MTNGLSNKAVFNYNLPKTNPKESDQWLIRAATF